MIRTKERAFLVAWLCMLATVALIALVRPVAAQAPSPTTDSTRQTTSVQDLQDLAATLEDEGKRTQLLTQIQALIAAQQTAAEKAPLGLGQQLVDFTSDALSDAAESIDVAADYFSDWPVLVAWIERELNDPVARTKDLHDGLSFLAIFVAGWVAEAIAWRLLMAPRRRLDASGLGRLLSRLAAIVLRFLLDLLPLSAFAAASHTTAVLMEPTKVVQEVGLNFVYAYLAVSGLLALARLLLAPAAAGLRLLPLEDATAARLFRWIRRFVLVGIVGYFVIGATLLLGLPRRGAGVLLTILGLILAVMAIRFVVAHRHPVADWLRAAADRTSSKLGLAQALRALAMVWHVLAILYVAAFFFIAAFAIHNGFSYMLRGTLLTVLIVCVAVVLQALIRQRLHALSDSPADGAVADRWQARAGYYLPVASMVLRLAVVAAAIVLVCDVWGLPSVAWLTAPSGLRTLGGIASILLVILAAVVVWEMATAAIERSLARQQEGSTANRRMRLRTLLPLLRKALFGVLCVMVVLITLSEIGVDIAPLLAGAGVVGLAIGFGAQKLVQDVITGIFMLLEDAIAVGDVVNVAGVGGLVEDLSIRSIRLRDVAGNVHTVPFSAVTTVTNMTKDFSYSVFDIGVAYREDTDEISRIAVEIIDEMRAEPRFSFNILEPMEVLGVDQFADSAVIVKTRVKTRPIQQWAVAREFNRRLKKRFDAAGIEMPFPHRTLYMGVDKSGSAPPMRVQTEGASAAIVEAAPIPAEGIAPPSPADESPAPPRRGKPVRRPRARSTKPRYRRWIPS